MADEKSKIVTDATGPDTGPVLAQPEADGGTTAPKQEQPAPEVVSPEAKAPEQTAPAQPDKTTDAPKEQKAASVSVFNFSVVLCQEKVQPKHELFLIILLSVPSFLTFFDNSPQIHLAINNHNDYVF